MIFNQVNNFDDREHEALMGIWSTGILLKQQSRRFFKDYVVSESQFNVIMTLKYAEKPLSQQALSERLLVDKSNLTGLVDGLEKLGFVKRRNVPNDRRLYRLELTEKGTSFLDEVEPSYRKLVKKIMSVYSADDLKQITAYMVRLQEGLDDNK